MAPIRSLLKHAVPVVLVAAAGAALPGCDEASRAGITVVKISGKTFYLEEAVTAKVRLKGLGERTSIDPNGGMIFAFADRDVREQSFIMRDCPIPIDIIYLNGSGRVLSWHEMEPGPARKPDEGTPADLFSDDPAAQARSAKYDRSLKGYPSRFPAQFVIELKGGTNKTLNLKEGMQIIFDYEGLKKRAQ